MCPLHGLSCVDFGRSLWCPCAVHGASGVDQRAFDVTWSAQEDADQRPLTLQAPVPQGAGGWGPCRAKQERCKRGARLGSLPVGSRKTLT